MDSTGMLMDYPVLVDICCFMPLFQSFSRVSLGLFCCKWLLRWSCLLFGPFVVVCLFVRFVGCFCFCFGCMFLFFVGGG